jgi:hypothetical protein
MPKPNSGASEEFLSASGCENANALPPRIVPLERAYPVDIEFIVERSFLCELPNNPGARMATT